MVKRGRPPKARPQRAIVTFAVQYDGVALHDILDLANQLKSDCSRGATSVNMKVAFDPPLDGFDL